MTWYISRMERVSRVDAAFAIVVNGETREIPRGMSVGELLAAHGLDPDLVVVERNGRILRREEFDAMRLDREDRLEIVHFVGGG